MHLLSKIKINSTSRNRKYFLNGSIIYRAYILVHLHICICVNVLRFMTADIFYVCICMLQSHKRLTFDHQFRFSIFFFFSDWNVWVIHYSCTIKYVRVLSNKWVRFYFVGANHGYYEIKGRERKKIIYGKISTSFCSLYELAWVLV